MEGIFNKLLKGIGDPVDFELPEWLNKYNPTAYKFMKRNIYLTKRNKRRPEDDGIFCSCNSSTGSSGVCDRDCLCGVILPRRIAASTNGVVALLLLRVFAHFVISLLTNFVDACVGLGVFRHLCDQIEVS